MIRKLRIKFICTNMLIVLILLSIMLGLVLSFTRTRLENDSLQMLRSIATMPMMPFQPDERSNDVRLPFFKLTLSKEGELISREGGSYDLTDEQSLQELTDSVNAKGKEFGIIPEYQLRYLVRETPREKIIVFSDISSESRTLEHLFRNCMLIWLGGLALFFIVSILLSRWAVKPVEKAWEQQKQFVADASHELKTPLTVILTDTELLQSETCEAEDRSRFLDSIHTMGEQMRGLVEELLSLTRADDQSTLKSWQKIDLSKCVMNAVLPFEPVFFEKGLSVETDIDDSISVNGNDKQLRQVVEILLDNAQKYSTPGSETNVSLKRQGRNALLSVESSGEEISKEEREKIFDRFYRMDKARSMNHSYGLGLAIAKQIVENHKGKIWVDSRDGCNRFCVQLPVD